MNSIKKSQNVLQNRLVNLIQWVKIAHLFLRVTSKLFHFKRVLVVLHLTLQEFLWLVHSVYRKVSDKYFYSHKALTVKNEPIKIIYKPSPPPPPPLVIEDLFTHRLESLHDSDIRFMMSFRNTNELILLTSGLSQVHFLCLVFGKT